jgi:hypothetical protein
VDEDVDEDEVHDLLMDEVSPEATIANDIDESNILLRKRQRASVDYATLSLQMFGTQADSDEESAA